RRALQRTTIRIVSGSRIAAAARRRRARHIAGSSLPMVRSTPGNTRARASRLGAMSGFDVDAARAALETRHPTWVPRSLHATLEDVAAEHAARPFVIAVDGELSYSELDAWSRRVARGIVAAGVA